MASTYIKRTCDGAYTSTFTWSAWVKRSATGSYHGLFCNKKNDSNSNSRVRFYISDGDRLAMEVKDSTSGDDSFFQTNKLFRDINAWYHIVLAYDTTQGAENDRIKLWVNNEEITSWEQFNRAGSGFGTLWSSAMEHRIGTQNSNAGTNYYFDGSMSHVHLTYGTAYTPSAFGETDATTGEWKIKTSPSVTYGSQGYFVLKDGNSLTDQSGEGNNFTVGGGTLTKTEDNPSNVFATLNPLAFTTAYTLSNGNNYFNGGTITSWVHGVPATIGASSGKYYWEVKWKNGTSVSIVGVLPIDKAYHCSDTGGGAVYNYSNGWQLSNSGNGDKYNYVASNGAGFQRAHDDVIMFAMDMDNKKMWSGYNGTWYSSGNPATGANPTWDTSEFPSDWDNGFIPYCQSYYSGTVTEFAFNFGNGYFGTTAVSSAGSNASGIGIFEYDVPTGYTALSTKGLNL